jgi:uncharacterized Zn finger protein
MVQAPSPTSSVVPASVPVQLPDLGMDAYRAIVAQLPAEQPEHRARIGRAINVLLTSDILETGELGVYLVQSCQDSGHYYRATTWSCSCPDRQRHESPCKHSYALQVLSVASAQAAHERAQTRYLLTAKGEAALAARA